MIRSGRFLVALVLLAWTLALSSGCSLFGQKEEPKKPLTVQDWMAQPRVKP